MIVRRHHRVLVQGITGKQGTFWSQKMIECGTRVVGGDLAAGGIAWRSATTPTLAGATLIDGGEVALVRAADLYVGFASAMAIEACAVGIPQVHLHGWPPEAAEWPSAAPFKQRFFIEKGGLWNVAGSRSVTCYGEDWPMRLHETLDDTLAEFSLTGPGAMRRACERWAGPLDGASARFLDALESRR